MLKQKKVSIQRGMSVTEYAVLLAVVVTALLGMQIFLKRAVCGNWKQAGDVFGFGRQAARVEWAK
jgi:Flp pilus assembly pilin Flp